MEKIKKVGVNFLHTHQQTERLLNLDEEHVIVDYNDWRQTVDYFVENPDHVKQIGIRKLDAIPTTNIIEIGTKPLKELTAENILDIVMIVGAHPCPEFWNKPIITDFDNTTFSDTIVIEYHAFRKEDNRKSKVHSFYFKFNSLWWHYVKDFDIHHKIQRHHTKNCSLAEIRYLIQQGFDVPLYDNTK